MNKVTVCTDVNIERDSYTSWLEILWNTWSDDIVEQYEKEGFAISFDTKQEEGMFPDHNRFYDAIIIDKI